MLGADHISCQHIRDFSHFYGHSFILFWRNYRLRCYNKNSMVSLPHYYLPLLSYRKFYRSVGVSTFTFSRHNTQVTRVSGRIHIRGQWTFWDYSSYYSLCVRCSSFSLYKGIYSSFVNPLTYWTHCHWLRIVSTSAGYGFVGIFGSLMTNATWHVVDQQWARNVYR